MHITINLNINVPEKLLSLLEGLQPHKAVEKPKVKQEQSPIVEPPHKNKMTLLPSGNIVDVREMRKPGKNIVSEVDNEKLVEQYMKMAKAFIARRIAFRLKDIIPHLPERYNKRGKQFTEWLETQTDWIVKQKIHLGYGKGTSVVYYPFWYENGVKMFAEEPKHDQPQVIKGAAWKTPYAPVNSQEDDDYYGEAQG